MPFYAMRVHQVFDAHNFCLQCFDRQLLVRFGCTFARAQTIQQHTRAASQFPAAAPASSFNRTTQMPNWNGAANTTLIMSIDKWVFNFSRRPNATSRVGSIWFRAKRVEDAAAALTTP